MSASTEGKATSGSDKSADSKSQRQSMGSEARRTTIFVGVALTCLVITGIFEWASRPAEIKEYGKVGQEFYPEFTDPTVATSLSVKVVDADELKPLEFSVKQSDNGRWVIPSHHNYPADAADQLAETASSVIGIQRGAMVTRWKSDHARYGVVDPETDSVGVDEIDGIGKRLTLRGTDDTVLASYIIGKKVDGEINQYYVRHPGEDETYIAELEISLSTKFRDWVKTDLLDIDVADARRLVLHDYSFEERGRSLAVTNTVETIMSRDSATGDWTMDALDTATQEVNAQAVGETVNALADLEIAGVRPKQPGLTANLQLDRSVVNSQRDVDRLQNDLLARGFLLQPSPSDPETLRLISREGELSIGTDDGLMYLLHFGRVFTGSDEELEIGLSADSNKNNDNASDDPEATAGTDGDDESDAASGGSESGKPGRYVFVRVDVDPSLLGDRPDPVDPPMPPELAEAENNQAEETEADDPASPQEEVADETGADPTVSEAANQDDAEQPADSSDTADASEEASDESANEDAKAQQEAELQQLREAYGEAKQKYQSDLAALQEYEARLEEAKKKAEDLNRRFAQWYYVIAGESYDKLSLSREDLVQAKTADDAEPEPMPALNLQLPSIDNPTAGLPGNGIPSEQEPATPSEPATDQPAPSEPNADTANDGEPASDPTADPESPADAADTSNPSSDDPTADDPASEDAAAETPAAESTEPASPPSEVPAESPTAEDSK